MSYRDQDLSPTDSGMADFKECLKLLRDGYPEESLLHVRRALQVAPNNPFYLSYAGLLAALVERRFANAEMLCRQALEIRHNHPQLYLNLAEVHERAGRLEDAVQVLEKGLLSTGRDVRIERALKRCGVRRNPVLSFLHRSHPMNRILGRWRHRLAGPARAA
jgi:Flp pilus assembly protein TadD